MARKLIGGAVFAALLAGLVGVSAAVFPADQSAQVPFDRPAAAAKSQSTDSATVDLSNWTESRDVLKSSTGRR